MNQIRHIKQTNNKNLIKSFYHSWCGLKAVFHKDLSFKIEVFFSAVVIPLAIILGTSAIDRAILIGSWFIILLMEILNSSIEVIVDRISLEIHPLSKKIKDIGSAAVLLSIINAIIVWSIILVGNFW